MKVYIVFDDNDAVCFVCATMELAEKCAADYKSANPDSLSISEYEVYTGHSQTD
jgi:hypothetical protein